MKKTHRQMMYDINRIINTQDPVNTILDPRKNKRAFRSMGVDAMMIAHGNGQAAAYDDVRGKTRRNHYHAGERHRAFDEGFASVDLMGDWHGRNE